MCAARLRTYARTYFEVDRDADSKLVTIRTFGKITPDRVFEIMHDVAIEVIDASFDKNGAETGIDRSFMIARTIG